jgi:hypothetical protein
MFTRLLSCDANFKQEWETGVYSIPEDPSHTMYLSAYIKKQSALKKISRKINNYVYNEKLTKGAKNLLESYMRGYSTIQNKNMDSKMEEMFCGIFKQISDRKESYVTKATKELPDELAKEITGYLAGGTKRKRCKVKTRVKTRKNRKYLEKSKNQKKQIKLKFI